MDVDMVTAVVDVTFTDRTRTDTDAYTPFVRRVAVGVDPDATATDTGGAANQAAEQFVGAMVGDGMVLGSPLVRVSF